MYLDEVLQNSCLSEDAPLDDDVVILPADSFAWCDKPLIVHRAAWDDIYARYRGIEPDAEFVMTMFLTARGSDFYHGIGELDTVREHYLTLRTAGAENPVEENTSQADTEDVNVALQPELSEDSHDEAETDLNQVEPEPDVSPDVLLSDESNPPLEDLFSAAMSFVPPDAAEYGTAEDCHIDDFAHNELNGITAQGDFEVEAVETEAEAGGMVGDSDPLILAGVDEEFDAPVCGVPSGDDALRALMGEAYTSADSAPDSDSDSDSDSGETVEVTSEEIVTAVTNEPTPAEAEPRDAELTSYIRYTDDYYCIPDPSTVAEWARPCTTMYHRMYSDYNIIMRQASLDVVLESSNISAAEFADNCGACVAVVFPDNENYIGGIPLFWDDFMAMLRRAYHMSLSMCRIERVDEAADLARLFSKLIYEE